MLRISIISCFTLFYAGSVHAQTNVRDSVVFAPLISVAYAFQVPGGDLSKRFGNNSAIGGSFMVKDKHNYVYGFSGDFLFGNSLKETDLLLEVTTSQGYVISNEGIYADVRLYERGYSFQFHFGKQFAVLAPNENSGFYVMGGVGMLQHKIKIDVVNDDVPQLKDENLHGYDRMTNGVSLSQTVGYRFLGNYRMTNFFVEIQIIEGFTKNRRSYNIDLMEANNNQSRFDMLTAFRFGWSVPLYKKMPKEYYFY
jgi:hypothetical protein